MNAVATAKLDRIARLAVTAAADMGLIDPTDRVQVRTVVALATAEAIAQDTKNKGLIFQAIADDIYSDILAAA